MHLTLTCNGEHINPHCSNLGHCNDRLSDRGILESLRLAKKLKNQNFDFIFCSDFGYRRTTTDLIVEALLYKESKIIVDANLREKDADICSQMTKQNIEKAMDTSPENGQILSRLFIKNESIPISDHKSTETTEEVYRRCQHFLQELLHTYPTDANILIVGSPIINSFIICSLKGEKEFTNYITSPCSISQYERRGHRWIEECYNERSHLYVK